MQRRTFLGLAAMVSVMVENATLVAQDAVVVDGETIQDTNSRNMKAELDVVEVGVEELQRMMTEGKFSAEWLTAFYLERIKHMNSMGPYLSAVITTNRNAMDEARALDSERKAGKVRGALHGIPVLIKDNINTANIETSAGARALERNEPKSDAFVVAQLRAAGAVILGKTNLSEWANFRSRHSISGWSSRGGMTRNPYVLDRSASGSSSGSGAAAAASLCAVAVGTETDGSIIGPSSHCALVGLKPTVGLLSRSGIVPIAASQDTAGPMTRSVRDCAVLLEAMQGVDPQDSAMKSQPTSMRKDYSNFDAQALKGKRIGYDPAFLKAGDALKELYEEALKTLRDLGAVCEEHSILSMFNEVQDAEFKVLLYEFKDGVNRYLKEFTKIKDLNAVIQHNIKYRYQEMNLFGQDILEDAQACGDLHDKAYLSAKKSCEDVALKLSALMKEHKLDFLCSLSCGPAACIDVVNGDYSNTPYFTSPAAIAGWPHVSVPAGMIKGLPVGFSLMSPAWTEHALLSAAYLYEQQSKKRVAPSYLPSVKF